MGKNIIISIKDGINLEKFRNNIDEKYDFSISRLCNIRREVDIFRLSSRNTSTNDEELFNNMIYPYLSQTEKDFFRLYTFTYNNYFDENEVLRDLKNSNLVDFAEFDELNVLCTPTNAPARSFVEMPNDTLFNKQWGTKRIMSTTAWTISKGENVVVGVVDTGIDSNHPDIAENMWRDSHGNCGYNFSENNTDTKDDDGHGTHVAGIIAATCDNNQGITGVAPLSKVMALKVFPNAYDSNIIRSWKYAVDHGVKVINNSWRPNFHRPVSKVMETAVEFITYKSCSLVFSSGNDNEDIENYSPHNHRKVITVSAINHNNKRVDYANYGKNITCCAPGVDIISLRNNSQEYSTRSGTSSAAPHITGVIALMLSKNHNAYDFKRINNKFDNPLQIIQALKYSSEDIDSEKNIGGVVNAYKAVNPIVGIKACNGKFVCAENGGNDPLISSRSWIDNWETFKLVHLGDNKIALKACNDRFVSADDFGNLPLIANKIEIGECEIFTYHDLGEHKFALKACNGSFVCADNSGKEALIANKNWIDFWETFYLREISIVAIKACNGKHICAENAGRLPLIASREWIDSWETFKLINLDKNKVALRACNGKFVCAEKAGTLPLIANREWIRSWEIFDLVRLDNNKFALRACNGKFVCADKSGQGELIANRDHIYEWETFEFV